MSKGVPRRERDDRDVQAKREELSYLLGERSDFLATKATTIADVVAAGERVDYTDLAAARDVVDELDHALDQVERLPEN